MDFVIVEKQQARDYDIDVLLSEDGKMSKRHFPVEKRDESTKCHRCYQYGVAHVGDYNLCKRCQHVLCEEYNSLCVSCGNNEATDNLCHDCRQKRITEFDKNYKTTHDNREGA